MDSEEASAEFDDKWALEKGENDDKKGEKRIADKDDTTTVKISEYGKETSTGIRKAAPLSEEHYEVKKRRLFGKNPPSAVYPAELPGPQRPHPARSIAADSTAQSQVDTLGLRSLPSTSGGSAAPTTEVAIPEPIKDTSEKQIYPTKAGSKTERPIKGRGGDLAHRSLQTSGPWKTME